MLWVNVARQKLRHLNAATFVEFDVSGRRKASGWHKSQQFRQMPADRLKWDRRWGISSLSADYAPMRFPVFKG